MSRPDAGWIAITVDQIRIKSHTAIGQAKVDGVAAGGPGFASMPSFLDSAGDEGPSEDGTLAIPDVEPRDPDPSESGPGIEWTTDDTGTRAGITTET